MKWFQDEPKRPEIPAHLDESARRTQARINTENGTPHWRTGLYVLADLPAMVEPRLRAEAADYLRQLEQWKRQHDEWEKGQPYSDREAAFETRMFDGEWIYPGLIHDGASNAYRDLADAGADEATLRREAATIYEFVRMRRALEAKETENAERMDAEAKRLLESERFREAAKKTREPEPFVAAMDAVVRGMVESQRFYEEAALFARPDIAHPKHALGILHAIEKANNDAMHERMVSVADAIVKNTIGHEWDLKARYRLDAPPPMVTAKDEK